MKKTAKALLKFIDESQTAFHVVETIENDLKSKKYQELKEDEDWKIEANQKYYVKRADASIILFTTPKNFSNKTTYKIIGAHTDSPSLKVKSNPVSSKEGYQLLNIEIYGGVLLTSWFDKDLNLGGRVYTENQKGELESHLVRLPYKLRIPRLAIHMDRGVNSEGFKPNPQTHMFPVMGLGKEADFESILQKQLKTKDKIMSWDLYMYDTEPCSLGGMNEEFIYAPRLDNLASVHASLVALTESKNSADDIMMASYFHNEEVGSSSQNGAGSNFQEATLRRINAALGKTESEMYETISKSYFISADMAHAIHPGYTQVHDVNHKPEMNKGPVIKSNANVRYASDGLSIAKFKQWCNAANVPYQYFNISNDMGCGSTIGPMTASRLGIPTIDIGNAMLSMHSIREMAGTEDHKLIIDVFKEFYK
ncbi:MAG: M18 family aminopeptidase [Chitinophagales bacterium]